MAVLTAIRGHTGAMPIILMRRIHPMQHILMVRMALAGDSAEGLPEALGEGSAEGSAEEDDGGKLCNEVQT